MKFSMREVLFALTHPWVIFARPLTELDLAPEPMAQFARWFERAQRCFWLQFPDAMCLSTIDLEGYPEGRMVLLKEFDKNGFIFYTNHNSRKGRSLMANPRAALSFYWDALQLQVRIQGDVEPVQGAEADAYFASRPRTSQIGAWASLQSDKLESRAVLEGRIGEFEEKFKGQAVPRPEHWHGFRIKPRRCEFWKLRPSRLHDRFVYSLREDGGWDITRLYP